MGKNSDLYLKSQPLPPLSSQETLPTEGRNPASKTIACDKPQWSWCPAFRLREDTEEGSTGEAAHMNTFLLKINT